MGSLKKYLLQSVIVSLLLVGCGDNALLKNVVSKGLGSSPNALSNVNDSCAVALNPSAHAVRSSISNTDRLIARYQAAVSTGTNPRYTLERLGWAYVTKARESRDTGYYILAEKTAECIDHVVPGTDESLLLRGHVFHNLHRFADAEALARQLVERRGRWFDFALLGDVLMEVGALDEAAEAYQRVVNERPGPQAYGRIAQLRWLKGDLDGALEMMEDAVRATSPRATESAAWARVRLAWLLVQKDKLSDADAVLVEALALQAEYPPALHLRGRLLIVQQRVSEALPLLELAVQRDPLPEFRWSLYEALEIAGGVSAAEDQKSELMRTGEFEDRRTFSMFLANLGDDPDTALRLALGELKQREDVFTLDAVAWALSGAGMIDEARAFSRRALAEGTQDARLFFHAGVIAARAGDNQRAQEWLSKAGAIQQMLLPSERLWLENEFAAVKLRVPTLVSVYSPHQEPMEF